MDGNPGDDAGRNDEGPNDASPEDAGPEDTARQDAALEATLRRLADHHDPVPPDAMARAIASLTWRTIDTELAELSFDSLLDAGELVRGDEQPRSLTFRAAGLTVELEITREPGSCSLVGQLLPPGPATVQLRRQEGSVAVEADELGRFAAQSLPTGPLSLRCQPGHDPATAAVVTDWISI